MLVFAAGGGPAATPLWQGADANTVSLTQTTRVLPIGDRQP